jgi:hypothetical protein
VLYIEVADLVSAKGRVAGVPTIFGERTTFYGAREIGVFDPAGNVIVLSEPATKG